jgi:hypothetical protein
MKTTIIVKMEKGWSGIQDVDGPAQLSNNYLLFRSALEKGWKVEKVELAPSRDQYGFIYLVTLMRQSRKRSLKLILPRNYAVESLIDSIILPVERGQQAQAECR